MRLPLSSHKIGKKCGYHQSPQSRKNYGTIKLGKVGKKKKNVGLSLTSINQEKMWNYHKAQQNRKKCGTIFDLHKVGEKNETIIDLNRGRNNMGLSSTSTKKEKSLELLLSLTRQGEKICVMRCEVCFVQWSAANTHLSMMMVQCHLSAPSLISSHSLLLAETRKHRLPPETLSPLPASLCKKMKETHLTTILI